MVDAVNIFLLLSRYLVAGLEVALLERNWDVALVCGKTTSFANTGILRVQKSVVPVTSWDMATK